MTKAELQKLVNEGFGLDLEIKRQSKRLDEIKEILKGHSNGEACEVLAEGCKASVTFTGGRLEAILLPEKEERARELAGGFFTKLFCRRPIEDFETVAKALLGTENSEALVGMFRGVPSPRVSFRKI